MNHLIFVGNIRPDVSPFVEKSSIDLIKQICCDLKVNGLMIYTDGSFIFVLEGRKDAARLIRFSFENHEDISSVMTLLETEAHQTVFKDFKMTYCRSDEQERIPGATYLNDHGVDALLPKGLPEHIAVLVHNFSLVNQLAA